MIDVNKMCQHTSSLLNSHNATMQRCVDNAHRKGQLSSTLDIPQLRQLKPFLEQIAMAGGGGGGGRVSMPGPWTKRERERTETLPTVLRRVRKEGSINVSHVIISQKSETVFILTLYTSSPLNHTFYTALRKS